MTQSLTPIQRRVLGVLIEKSMAQPEYYPMTLNAITVACNQKSNRDPVMSLEDGAVGKALWELQQRGLAAQAEPDRNARANRFRHLAEEKLGWNARDRAIMAELLLRGPQTVGELRTHASRMMPFESTGYLNEVLAELAQRNPPMVRETPRAPGQSATRFAHLLYEPDEQPPAAAPAFTPAPPASESSSSVSMPSLEQRVAALEAAVAELRSRLA